MATITLRYEHEPTFTNLLTRIGIPVRESTKLNQDGFTNLKLLIDQYGLNPNELVTYLKDLNKTFGAQRVNMRLNFTPFLISRLVGLTHYYGFCVNSIHTLPDPDLIQLNDVNRFYTFYNQDFKSLDDDNDDNDVEVKVPDLADHTKWLKFRDSFTEKLAHTIGERKIPISYVIDPTVRLITRANATLQESATIIDITDVDEYVTTVMHFGPAFKKDSKTVWDILKALLLNTAGWYHISSYDNSKNGKLAFTALRNFYQGADFTQYMIDDAFNILTHTFYRGETKVFTFDKYVKLHLKAHSLLVEARYNGNLGMDEATKVQHFKSGIKPKANLESALIAMRSGTINVNDFHSVKSFLAGEIQARKSRDDVLESSNRRNVSGFNTNNNKKSKYNKKKSYGPVLTAQVEGKTVEGRPYSKEEWRRLSQPQQNKIKDLMKQRKNTAPSNTSSAAVSSVSVETMRDDMITLGDAIIAGVQRASASNNIPDDASALTTGTTPKRRADAGSVGEIFGKRRKSKDTA